MEDQLKQSRILIVDDQEMNILFLNDYLEMMGYTDIHTMTDAREIFDFCENQKPDLILLDLMMPKISGYEVLEKLAPWRSEGTFLPVLVLTADATNDAKKKALSLGATDFLTKPFDLNEVGLRIKNLLYTRSLVQQLQNINQGLEEKVRERTLSLEQTNEALHKALKRAAASDELKTAFMNNISHEVRTPLNGILGFSSLLLDSELTAEEKEEFAPHLQHSADRLMQTITDYMDIALLASESIEVHANEIDPAALLKDVYNAYQSKMISNSVSLELQIQEKIPAKIKIDRELLEKSIKHLLDNAFKFTKEGTISLGAENTDDGRFCFFVADTGKGIPADKQKLVFESFMQADISNTRAHEGSGLGLSIVKGFTDLMSAALQLESAPGKGSRFSIICSADDLGGKSNQENKLTSNGSFPLPPLLIVDDEETHHTLIKLAVKGLTSHIYHAYNGREAVDLVNQNKEIQLIFMDIKMPEMNGLEASKLILESKSDINIIALTAYAMHGDQAKAEMSGINHYITKPVTKNQLLASLKTMGYAIPEN